MSCKTSQEVSQYRDESTKKSYNAMKGVKGKKYTDATPISWLRKSVVCMRMADVTLATFVHSNNGVPAAAAAAGCPTKARRQTREVNMNMVVRFL